MAMLPTCSRWVFAGREGSLAWSHPCQSAGTLGGQGASPHLPRPAKPHTTWPQTCEEGLHELAVGHFHNGPPRVGRKRWISTVRQ